MKVHIGPYRNYFGPHQIANKIFFWVDRTGFYADEPPIYSRWDYRAEEKFSDWLGEQKWLVSICNWFESKKERKIKIQLDPYDTWSMDHTLALIIHPMLVQLKATNHGFFMSDPEDAPTIGKGDETDYGHSDSLAEQRYNWIMDELIWTFERLAKDDDYELFYTEEHGWDREGKHASNKRIENGLRLFGKYFRGLWD